MTPQSIPGEQSWWETLADVRELPSTMFDLAAPGFQNVAVTVTLPDGQQILGSAILALGDPSDSETP